MAKIKFSVKINNIELNSYMKLEGQQLYFFEQDSDIGKQKWIKSYLERMGKITNIKIEK